MVKFDFEFRLLMAFSAVMMLVAMLSGLTWSHANSAATAASKVEQALEVLNHLAHIRSHTVQVELNTQAYRMTGNPVNLTERNATIAERELLMQRLRIFERGIFNYLQSVAHFVNNKKVIINYQIYQ